MITGPKSFHRQGAYHNWLHRMFTILMPLIAIPTAIAGLVTVIVGTAILGRGGGTQVFNTAGTEYINTNRNIALWIIDAALIPVVILSTILAVVFSLLAMRYEKNLAKYNNDANVGEQNKRRKSTVARWLALIPCFLNELLILGLMGYFIATVIVSSYRNYQWRALNTFLGGCPSGISDSRCDNIGSGYDTLLAGTILSLCSTIFPLILNSMALSHLGSRENKVDVYPPQQVSVVSNATTIPSSYAQQPASVV